jgi:single-strand DNA-binding protein
MSRSLNKVLLIGNLTRDPELRYTPQGSAVCTFGLATNRYWTTESGEKKEEVEFHKIVAWNKLGELCGQLLTKGRKVYVEGRLQTRKWTAQDGSEHATTEVVISDMVLLDSRGVAADVGANDFDIPEEPVSSSADPSQSSSSPADSVATTGDNVSGDKSSSQTSSSSKSAKKNAGDDSKEEDLPSDDIPF